MNELLESSCDITDEVIYTKSAAWPAELSQGGLLLLNFSQALEAHVNSFEVRIKLDAWHQNKTARI